MRGGPVAGAHHPVWTMRAGHHSAKIESVLKSAHEEGDIT
jgi:hypothetical protein